MNVRKPFSPVDSLEEWIAWKKYLDSQQPFKKKKKQISLIIVGQTHVLGLRYMVFSTLQKV